jgi:osmotically inducible lipoprotein OsmB
MQRATLIALTALTLALAGCSGMSNTQQRMLSGGAIGAGSGAVLTGVTGGSVVGGALIGGALGTGAGYLYDRSKRD